MTENAMLIICTTLIMVAATLIPTYILTFRKKVTEESWAIADRSLPLYITIGTQFASMMGGGFLVAHVTNVFNNGIGVLLYGVLICLPFCFMVFVGPWLRENNFTTIPDIVGYYTNQNKVLKLVAAFFSLIVPFGWVTSNITAFGGIFATITGINYNLICLFFAIVSMLFILPAGLKTVAWTDTIFSFFIIIMCVISLVEVFSLGGGWGTIVANLNAIDPNLLSVNGSLANNIGLVSASLWVFALFPGGMTNQIYFQRVCAADSPKNVNKSLLISAAISMVAFLWVVFMGLSLRSVNPDLGDSTATAWFLGQLPPVLMALFAAFIFASIMSTMSSGIQTAVVNITRDITPMIVPDMDDKKRLTLSRVSSALLMTLAVLMCLIFTDTLTWLTHTYALSAACLFCPIYLSHILRKKNMVTTAGVGAGMFAGIAGCVFGIIFETAVSFAAIGVGVSAVVMLVVCYFTKENKK